LFGGGRVASEPVQLLLPGGETIWARVTVDDDDDGLHNVGSGVLQRLDVEDLRRTVRGVSGSVREALAGLVPDQLQVEFGLELAVKTGKLTSMLAEAGAMGSIKVTLTWNGQAPPTTSIGPSAPPPAAG
jgi:hypothetical protein